MLYLRDEYKKFEQRTPLTPNNARKLTSQGISVFVEKSKDRIFSQSDYEKAGCQIVDSGSWIEAPDDAIILGLKELPTEKGLFKHKHIYFAHSYKGQDDSQKVLQHYKKSGGSLYDLEYLTNSDGRRIAAFGYWAGFVGAALAVDIYCQANKNYQTPYSYKNKDELIDILKGKLIEKDEKPKALIIGAKGRCGSGARDLFAALELDFTPWDMKETAKGGPFKEILDHHLFINCVLVQQKVPPFIDHESLKENKKLKVISDISCDPNNPNNPIPIYNEITTMDHPVRIIDSNIGELFIQAIDHLPSMLPMESSQDFSDSLYPYLEAFILGSDDLSKTLPFKNAFEVFKDHTS